MPVGLLLSHSLWEDPGTDADTGKPPEERAREAGALAVSSSEPPRAASQSGDVQTGMTVSDTFQALTVMLQRQHVLPPSPFSF